MDVSDCSKRNFFSAVERQFFAEEKVGRTFLALTKCSRSEQFNYEKEILNGTHPGPGLPDGIFSNQKSHFG
jgi:hypothetical protein